MTGPVVFISYRQMHSFEIAARLEHVIEQSIPGAEAFLDQTDIGFGLKWRDVIEQHLDAASVVLLLISKAWFHDQWVSKKGRHEVLLARRDDEVRKELLLAKEREARFIPVLHNDGRLPEGHELPVELRFLSELQAVPIPRQNFRPTDPGADLRDLVDRLRTEFGPAPTRRVETLELGEAAAAWSGWSVRTMGDMSDMGTAELAVLVTDIVHAEGPIMRRRLYRLVGAATGVGRMSQLMRERVDAAVASSVRKKDLVDVAPIRKGGAEERETSVAGGPAVVVRHIGTRSIDEVPLTELAEAITIERSRAATSGARTDDDAIIREVARHYGVGRVTARVDETLRRAMSIDR